MVINFLIENIITEEWYGDEKTDSKNIIKALDSN
jgi:hypothetical protein